MHLEIIDLDLEVMKYTRFKIYYIYSKIQTLNIISKDTISVGCTRIANYLFT